MSDKKFSFQYKHDLTRKPKLGGLFGLGAWATCILTSGAITFIFVGYNFVLPRVLGDDGVTVTAVTPPGANTPLAATQGHANLALPNLYKDGIIVRRDLRAEDYFLSEEVATTIPSAQSAEPSDTTAPDLPEGLHFTIPAGRSAQIDFDAHISQEALPFTAAAEPAQSPVNKPDSAADTTPSVFAGTAPIIHGPQISWPVDATCAGLVKDRDANLMRSIAAFERFATLAADIFYEGALSNFALRSHSVDLAVANRDFRAGHAKIKQMVAAVEKQPPGHCHHQIVAAIQADRALLRTASSVFENSLKLTRRERSGFSTRLEKGESSTQENVALYFIENTIAAMRAHGATYGLPLSGDDASKPTVAEIGNARGSRDNSSIEHTRASQLAKRQTPLQDMSEMSASCTALVSKSVELQTVAIGQYWEFENIVTAHVGSIDKSGEALHPIRQYQPQRLALFDTMGKLNGNLHELQVMHSCSGEGVERAVKMSQLISNGWDILDRGYKYAQRPELVNTGRSGKRLDSHSATRIILNISDAGDALHRGWEGFKD